MGLFERRKRRESGQEDSGAPTATAEKTNIEVAEGMVKATGARRHSGLKNSLISSDRVWVVHQDDAGSGQPVVTTYSETAASPLPQPSNVERQTVVTGFLPNLASLVRGKSEVGEPAEE